MSDDPPLRSYHATPSVLRTLTIVMGVGFVVLMVRLLSEDDPIWWINLIVIATVAVVFALVFAWVKRSATVVSQEYVAIRGLFRTRTIPWSDIQGIEAALNPGAGMKSSAPNTIVVVFDSAGRKITLPHLTDRTVANLPREIESLHRTWRERRGDAWTPIPAVAAKIGEHHRYATSPWMVGVITAMLTLPVYIVFFIVMLATGAIDSVGWPLSALLVPEMMLVVPAVAFVGTSVGVIVVRRRRR